MKIAYVDTSVVLRFILGEENPFLKWDQFKRIYASSLLRVEALRTIDRFRLRGAMTDEEVALRINLLSKVIKPLSEIPLLMSVLNRAAEPFPTMVATLDALHLASAWVLKDKIGINPLFLTVRDSPNPQSA